MNFLNYLIKNNIDNKLYSLAFAVAIISYTFWQPLEDFMLFADENKGKLFFIGISFSFCCYTSAYMFTKWEKWRWFPMFVFFICLSRLGKELYYLHDVDLDPEKYDVFDYLNCLKRFSIISKK